MNARQRVRAYQDQPILDAGGACKELTQRQLRRINHKIRRHGENIIHVSTAGVIVDGRDA